MTSASYGRLVRAFKNQADISADGNTVSLAGYTAKRDPVGHFLHRWTISGPAYQVPETTQTLPGIRIEPDGGVYSRHDAIAVMARCAAGDFLQGKLPDPPAPRP